jgi:hypothetical protein
LAVAIGETKNKKQMGGVGCGVGNGRTLDANQNQEKKGRRAGSWSALLGAGGKTEIKWLSLQ